MKKAIIIGASGLIGSNLTRLLLSDNAIKEVVLLVRKPLSIQDPKLSQYVIDFDDQSSYSKYIFGDAFYCCIGTTKAKTPDEATYRRIDFQYPLDFARIAKDQGVKQLHLVSALGADSQSYIMYNKLKGELEEALKQLNFSCLCIYQPSLLIGERQESRPAERIAGKLMRVLNPLLVGPLKKYRSIKAVTVAEAMVINTHKNLNGVYVYTSDKIKEII